MFKNKAIKGLICLLAIMLAGLIWAKGEKGKKGTETAEAKKIQGGVQMEKYVPKVIIEAKWQKIKEKLVPHEWDPWSGMISCDLITSGKFGEGTVSFGFSHSNITELLPPRMPRSIAIDKDKNLYILDPVNLRVLKFNKGGMYLETINLEKRFEKEDFWFLEGREKIYVDKENNIYIKNVETVDADIKKRYFFQKQENLLAHEPILLKNLKKKKDLSQKFKAQIEG
jgi:hypothetical protein